MHKRFDIESKGRTYAPHILAIDPFKNCRLPGVVEAAVQI